MANRARTWLRFNVVVWLLALAVCAWLWTMPLIKNWWAAHYWQQIEARLADDGFRYSYTVDKIKYGSDRRDFWQLIYHCDALLVQENTVPNTYCWVSPANPTGAVRLLDAPQHFQNAWGRFAAGGLLLSGVLLVTRSPRKRNAQGGPR